MSNELATQQHNPFQRNNLPDHANVGAVAIEQERAIAEAQGKLVIAKRFPRDEARAFQMAMDACSRPSLAAVATYKFPRGGQRVNGPSIRLAEELARCWGNIDYGIRELSRKEGVSEMEAYAWDLQTNTMSSQKFTVKHLRDKAGGPVNLDSERDIYEVTANMGARRLRARLLAILPPDLVEAAENQCRAALAGNTAQPIADRVRDLLGMFINYGVKETQLSQYLGKSLDDVIEDDLINMHEVYNSIQQGISKPGDWFGGAAPAPQASQTDSLGSILAEQKAQQAQPKQPAPAEPETKPQTKFVQEDPQAIAQRYCEWIDSAEDVKRVDALYEEGINKLRELWTGAKDDKETRDLCGDFSRTLQAVYEEAKAKLVQNA